MKNVYIRLIVILSVLLCSAIPLYSAEYPVTINVNAASFIRTIPETMYGGNLTAWDGAQSGGNSTFNNLMIASGRKYQRWPGGSWGDAYLWSDMEGPGGANTWIVSYSETLNLLNILSQPGETVHPTLQPIVNFPGYWYGVDHSDAEAIAAAVAWVQDQSGRTPTAQYWEIGNEVFGPWEAGWFEGMRGSYYGDKFADFYLAMKAVNPNIKIGAVAQEYDVPDWWNPGLWTRELLVAAYAKGVVPDFLIIHQYPASDQPASYNSTLLGARVDDIASFTSSLNSIITSTIGPSYVGQVKYWMTEWDSGVVDGSYDRRQCFVNAMFHVQYALEIAKNNWEGSNAWAQWEYNYTNFFVYPVWYVHPLLIKKFGRNMVSASTTRPEVRAYASRDNDNNLTIFIVNNFPTTDAAITINISGFTAGTNGQRWLIEPAGTMIAGGATIQDYCDVNINGVIHPNPLTLDSLPPQAFTSGSTFSITLPMSRMVILKVPNAGDITPPAVPTGLSATGGELMVTLNWNDNTEPDLSGYNVYRSTTSGSGYVKQNGSLLTSSDYIDNNVDSYVTYYYVVTAVDNSFNESDDSSEASATPTDTTPPAAPTGLTAVADDGMVTLNWNNNGEGDLAGYNVYRSTTSGSGYVQINGSLLTNSDYIDNSVTNGITYYYVVTAQDASSNESGYSSEVSATPAPRSDVIIIGSWLPGTTHTKENGTERALVLVAHAEYGATTLNSVTYGGQAMTKVIDINVGSSSRVHVAAFILNETGVAAATNSTFVPSWSTTPSSVAYSSAFFGNVDQTALVGATARNSSNASTPNPITTSALTTQDGDTVIVAATCGNSGSYTLNNSFLEGTDQTMASTATGVTGYKAASGVPETPSATFSGTVNRQVIIGFVVRAAAIDIPPAAPTGLTVTPGVGTILLDWNDNGEGDLAGYNIWRMPEGGYYEQLNGSLVTVSNYTDTAVSNGATYYYLVSAVDTVLNESDASNEVSATPGTAPGTGAILREWWLGITGTAVSDLTSDVNYPDNPSGEELLISLEGPVNWGDNYGTRIRGYLNPVATGSYTFWLASDADSELWLSTDDNPANATLRAYVPGSVQSLPISLTASQKYYIEVLHKEGTGNDNISVSWQGPGIIQQVIDGIYLSPCCLDFENFADFATQWNQSGCNIGNDWCGAADFDRDGQVSIDDLKAFTDAWLAGI